MTYRFRLKRKLLKTLSRVERFEKATGPVSCGRIAKKRLVMWSQSQSTFIRKIQDADGERLICFFLISILLLLLAWLWIGNWMFMLINLNNAFYTCAVEGWKRFRSFSSFPCGRAKRYENDRMDAILSLRFQWNENAKFWKRIRVDGAWDYVRMIKNQFSVKPYVWLVTSKTNNMRQCTHSWQ